MAKSNEAEPIVFRKVRTPPKINDPILGFCKALSPLAPEYVNLKRVPGALEDECFPNVSGYVKTHGGSIQYGWTVWEKQYLYLEAEFHACVRDGDRLFDVTPKRDGEQTVLFLPDPVAVWDEKRVPNRFESLSDNPLAVEYTAVQRALSEEKCRVLGDKFGKQNIDIANLREVERLSILQTDLEGRLSQLKSADLKRQRRGV